MVDMEGNQWVFKMFHFWDSLLMDESYYYCCHRFCLIISSSLLKTFKTTQEKRHKYHPKKASPLPRFLLKWGSNSSLESYLKVFPGYTCTAAAMAFYEYGICCVLWNSMGCHWLRLGNGVTCSTPFFCSIKLRTKKTRRFHPIPVYLLNSSIERPLELTTLCSTMNHPFCSSQEGNPLSDGSSLPGTLEWKNATLQTMHLFIAPLLWLECLRHVVDEELGKVLQTIDIPKWLSPGFNHSSWLWCIQELHKTESHYQLIQNANPTTAARATNTKKNSTKQSQLKPTIETRKLEDKLRKEPDFSGKTDANDNLPGDASAA